MIVVRNIEGTQIISFYPKSLDVASIIIKRELDEVEEALIYDIAEEYNKIRIRSIFPVVDYNFYLLIAKDAEGNELFRDKLYALDAEGNTGTGNHFEALQPQSNSQQYITL